jgi:hypothetical protein
MRIEELENWSAVADPLGSGPTFYFLHVILPHPPLYLDASCGLNVQPGLGGRTLHEETYSDEQMSQRRLAYVAQTQCANQTVLAFLEDVDEDTTVIVTADHGPDSLGSMSGNPDQWAPEQIWERLSTFSAVRLPEACVSPRGEDFELVNTFRILLSCLTEEEIPLLDGEYFGATYGGPIFELKDPDSNVD